MAATVNKDEPKKGGQRRNRVVLLFTDSEFAEIQKRQAKLGPETSLAYVVREMLKKGAPEIFD